VSVFTSSVIVCYGTLTLITQQLSSLPAQKIMWVLRTTSNN